MAQTSTSLSKKKVPPPPSKPDSKKKAKESAKGAAKKANKENHSPSAATSGSKNQKSKQKKRADTPRPDVTAEHIAVMQARIKKLEGIYNSLSIYISAVNKLTHHETEAAKAVKVATPDKIVKIPAPEGTAGEDYNLQTMMKLGNDDRTYVAIRVGIIIYALSSGKLVSSSYRSKGLRWIVLDLFDGWC